MPRGRVRQTPGQARQDSEARILTSLGGHPEGRGFNQLQAETGLSPTTLSQRLGRLKKENKVYWNPRDGLYRPTEWGDRWLDVSAVIQRIINMARLSGAVGPSSGGGPGAEATAVHAMPSPGPGALSSIGNEVPSTLLEILLTDLVKRDLARRPHRSRLPGPKYTGSLLRRFPRILVLEIDWNAWSEKLDPRRTRKTWEGVLSRLPRGASRKRRKPSTRSNRRGK